MCYMLPSHVMVSSGTPLRPKQAAIQPRFAARMWEQTKFRVNACSSHPVARRHHFVPCIVEKGGRLGEHLLPLLMEMAERGVASGHLT